MLKICSFLHHSEESQTFYYNFITNKLHITEHTVTVLRALHMSEFRKS
jgi:hypothetical protein